MTAAALLCAAVLRVASGAADLTYDLGLNTEGRLRTVAATGIGVEHVDELELDPSAKVTAAGPTLDLSLAYLPIVTLSTLPGEGLVALHHLSAVSHWQAGPIWRTTLTADASHGTVSLFEFPQPIGVPGAPPPPSLTVPAVPTVETEDLRGGVALTGAPARRLQIDASILAVAGGGATALARTFVPFQRTLVTAASVAWDAERTDRLTSKLTATASTFSTGQEAAVAILSETWRRVLTAELTLTLGAGGAAADQRATGPAHQQALPTGEAGIDLLTNPGGLPLHANLDFTAAPIIDPIFGAVGEQLGGGAIFSLGAAGGWRVEATGSGGFLVTGVEKGGSVWSGLLRVVHPLGGALDVALGVRGIYERQPLFASRIYDWNAFVQVAARDHGRL